VRLSPACSASHAMPGQQSSRSTIPILPWSTRTIEPADVADRRSHEVIVNGLSGLEGMDIPFLSEEGKNIPF